jgi:hypothetical protein
MAAPLAPACDYQANLKQAQARVSTLISTTTDLNGWVPLTGSTIPPSMKIYEKRDGTFPILSITACKPPTDLL